MSTSQPRCFYMSDELYAKLNVAVLSQEGTSISSIARDFIEAGLNAMAETNPLLRTAFHYMDRDSERRRQVIRERSERPVARETVLA